MVTKNSKQIVDNILKPLYSDHIPELESYEQDIIQTMLELSCTLSESMEIDFDAHLIDTESVLDMTDYLEYRLKGDLNKVSTLMQIYTGKTSDFVLQPYEKEKKITD